MEGIVGLFVVVALVMLAVKLWKVVMFFIGLFILFWVCVFAYAWWTDPTLTLAVAHLQFLT